jgi:Brp/Blh family beta-carotene 15,15'-monooxygenase
MKKENMWWAGVLVLTALLVSANQSGSLPENWWLIPWLLSLVLFGLPHGAIDHEVALTLWQPKPPPQWAMVAILAGYLFLSLIILAAWFLIPYLVFFGFILLTWSHWGLSDLWWSWHRDASYFGSRGHRVTFALWRGAIPILVPLVFYPSLYRQTAEATCNLFSSQTAHFDFLESNLTRSLALGAAVILGAADFCLAKGSMLKRRLNLAESLALLLYFALVPALVSVGFYFAFWHGLRHVLRLKIFERLSWRGFAIHALPATLGALVLLAALAYFVQFQTGYLVLLGIYLSLIAALTLPHALIVNWMDVREGLWKQS